jgi:hypothetical protein
MAYVEGNYRKVGNQIAKVSEAGYPVWVIVLEDMEERVKARNEGFEPQLVVGEDSATYCIHDAVFTMGYASGLIKKYFS